MENNFFNILENNIFSLWCSQNEGSEKIGGLHLNYISKF
jgi:hypothetical protein